MSEPMAFLLLLVVSGVGVVGSPREYPIRLSFLRGLDGSVGRGFGRGDAVFGITMTLREIGRLPELMEVV